MKTDYDTSWAAKLDEIYAQHRKFYYEDDEREAALKALSDINSRMDGYFELLNSFSTLVQLKPLPWKYIFDILKNTKKCSVLLKDYPIPAKYLPAKSEKLKVYASFLADKGAVQIQYYTGRRREDLSGYDGYGREPDELEFVSCLRDRDGNLIEDWHPEWV